jgi:hypothetical protein
MKNVWNLLACESHNELKMDTWCFYETLVCTYNIGIFTAVRTSDLTSLVRILPVGWKTKFHTRIQAAGSQVQTFVSLATPLLYSPIKPVSLPYPAGAFHQRMTHTGLIQNHNRQCYFSSVPERVMWPKIRSERGSVNYTDARKTGSETPFRLASFWERTSGTASRRVPSHKYPW